MLVITKEGESGAVTKEFSYSAGWNILTGLCLPITRWLRARSALRYMQARERHLDIGCGDGYFLRRSGCSERYGLDRSLGDPIEDKLDFPENYFDYVTMLASIEHFQNPDKLIDEIWRVLKPGGRLIITTPKRVAESLILIYSPKIKDEHKAYFDLPKIKDLAGNKFKIAGYHTFIFGLNQVFCLEKLNLTHRDKPKIMVFTIESSFFYPQLWEKVLLYRPDFFRGVFLFQRLPSKYSSLKHKYLEISFLGVRNILKMLIFNLRDRLIQIVKNGKPLTVKGVFEQRGIPVYKYKSIKDPVFKEKLKELAPDLVVSIGTHQIIPQEILDIPKDGVLNKHNSLLPEYAGFWPLFWALYHNAEFTGVTFHRMLSKPDAGEIIHQRGFKIEKEDTLYTLEGKALLLAADLVIEICDFYLRECHLPKFSRVDSKKEISLGSFPKRKNKVYLERILKRRIV